MLVKMDDFKKDDGNIDWREYHRAQVNVGERCKKCETFLTFSKGYATLCHNCKEVEDSKDEVWHDELVRCPKCGRTWKPYESEDYHLLADGEHSATCNECDHSFEISTTISFSFNSPAMIQEEEPEPVEEEEEDDPETVQEVENSES